MLSERRQQKLEDKARRHPWSDIDEDALANLSGEEEEKERKRRLKKKFMEPELSFDDMFKQSCARVNFMKTRRDTFHPVGSTKWQSYQTAAKYLSQFKYNKAKNDESDVFFVAAIETGRVKDADQYREEANRYLGKCLFAHYVIGKLYTEFLEERLVV